MMILATSSRVRRSTVCEPMSPAPPITARVFPRMSMSFDQFETVRRPAVALARARTDEIEAEPFAGAAHPADPARGPGADEAVFAEHHPAQDRRIGADRRALAYPRRPEFRPARDVGAGIEHVGEH